MKPYYADDLVTLYHGYCRDVLLSVDADVVVSDPPYGINHTSGGSTKGKWHVQRHGGFKVAGDDKPFDPSFLVALGLPMILWGANFYSDRLPGGGWLVWDKRPGIEDMKFNRSDSELAYFSGSKTVKTFRHLWHGLCRATEVGEHLHPTQKPEALMRWCIELVGAGIVLDPFAGSGTTLAAAKRLGRKSIGVELEERYCEISARRLAQGTLAEMFQ